MSKLSVVKNQSSENSALNFLGKKIELDGSGNIVKTSSAYLHLGTVKNIDITNLSELENIIKNLDSSEALILGTCPQANNDEEFLLGSKNVAINNIDYPITTRNKSNFTFSNEATTVLLDFDEHPAFSEGITATKFRDFLILIMPDFKDIEMLIVPSSSSNIYKIDEEQPIKTNKYKRLHIYITIDDGTKIGDLFNRLEYVGWRNGLGYHKISSNGAQLKRHLFDSAVGSPERLVYESKPLLGAGLTQIDRKFYHYDGGILDTSKLALSPAEKSKLKNLIQSDRDDSKYSAFIATKQKIYHDNIVKNFVKDGLSDSEALDYADKILQSVNTLPSVAKLKCENGLIISVQDVLDNFDDYANLSFVDPLQTHESNEFRAKIFKNADGTFVMHSFRHGGTKYFLQSATLNTIFSDKHPSCIEKMLQYNTKKQSIQNSVELLASYVKSRAGIDGQVLLNKLIENANNANYKHANVDIRSLYANAVGDAPDFDCESVKCFSNKLMCRNCPLFQSRLDSYNVVDIHESIPDFSMRCPDVIVRGENNITMPSTVENLKFLLKYYGIECEYDEILKKPSVFIVGDKSHKDLSDEANLKVIRSLGKKNDVKDDVSDYLINVFSENAVNPVLDWIESKKWDGVSRMPMLMDTLTLSDETHQNYAETMIKTWLIQCIAALDGGARTPLFNAIKKYELVLVFTGSQGLGKTSWFKSLIPYEMKDYFSEGEMLNITEKDSVKRCISNWIVELGEIDSTFGKSEISMIKAFLSKTEDNIRLPYAATHSNFSRRTSFCGTVNELHFLHDTTGNRRFLPIHVTECKFSHSIDLQQLWAEILHLYLDGAIWWLNAEAKQQLEDTQVSFRSVSVVEEQLFDYFDLENSSTKQKFSGFYSTTKALKAAGIEYPNGANISLAKKIFTSLGINEVKNSVRGYWLVVR
jgi:putative DNA primase/helicase